MEYEFGRLLRQHRNQCLNPQTNKPFSQAYLAELIAYSDKSISNWESGKRLPKRQDRQTQIKLVATFVKYGAMDSAVKANQFLLSGGFAVLSAEECANLNLPDCQPPPQTDSRPSPPAPSPVIFTNIWYTDHRYSLKTLWRDYELGTLFIEANQLRYVGEKTKLEITQCTQLEHTRQYGDLNANWVKLIYQKDEQTHEAWFAQASRLGIGNLIGGSHDLFESLWEWWG
ncbi:MAG TPA: XRE family transcriptional regulator [Anaerolineae bacterium]|nr:XRE family transcriptional regulator [Anaerolineae bacterium]